MERNENMFEMEKEKREKKGCRANAVRARPLQLAEQQANQQHEEDF